MALIMHKIVNQKDGTEIFFNSKTGSVFESSYQQAMKYVKRNKGKFLMNLYFKDMTSSVNLGWKFQGQF